MSAMVSMLLSTLFLSLLIIVNAAVNSSSQLMTSDRPTCPIAYRAVHNNCVCIPEATAPVLHQVICDIDSKNYEQKAYLVYGSCISLDNPGWVESQVIFALCPFTAGKHAVSPGIEIPKWPENLYEYCERFNRSGRLCEKCSNSSYGVDALSTTFDCIPCTDSIANWFKYFTVKLLPLTLFFIIIVFFHIGVTSAAVNGFIMYSQIITLPLYVLVIESGIRISLENEITADTTRSYTQILTAPLSIWSLGFDFIGYIFAHNGQICLSQNIKIIHILALEYISASYPLLLLVVVYGLIELHSRNCWPLVYIWKACTVCVRFRRQWNIRTSLIDSFATFFLLSYTKYIFVSLSLITPSNVHILVGANNISKKVLLYDPSVEMYSTEHRPYAALACVVLIVCNLTSLFLFFYSFKFIQCFLNCFSCCPSLVQAIHTFADAIHGCFKSGKDGGPNRRYFAGIYLIFRSIIVYICSGLVHDYSEIFSGLAFLYLILLFLIFILQPYNHHFYNCLDAVFLIILIIHSLIVYAYFSDIKFLHGWSLYIRKQYYSLVFVLLFVPLAYFTCFMCYWIIVHLRCTKRVVLYLRARLYPIMELTPLLDSQQHTMEPDRLVNPERYEEETNENCSTQD